MFMLRFFTTLSALRMCKYKTFFLFCGNEMGYFLNFEFWIENNVPANSKFKIPYSLFNDLTGFCDIAFIVTPDVVNTGNTNTTQPGVT